MSNTGQTGWQTPSHAVQRAAAAAEMFEQAFQRSGFSESQLNSIFEANPGDLGAVLRALTHTGQTTQTQPAGCSVLSPPVPNDILLDDVDTPVDRSQRTTVNGEKGSHTRTEVDTGRQSSQNGIEVGPLENQSKVSARKRSNSDLDAGPRLTDSSTSKRPRHDHIAPSISPLGWNSPVDSDKSNDSDSKRRCQSSVSITGGSGKDGENQANGKAHSGILVANPQRPKKCLRPSDEVELSARNGRKVTPADNHEATAIQNTLPAAKTVATHLNINQVSSVVLPKTWAALEKLGFTTPQIQLIIDSNWNNPKFNMKQFTGDSEAAPLQLNKQAAGDSGETNLRRKYGMRGNPIDETKVDDLVHLTDLNKSTVMRVLHYTNGDFEAAAEYMMEERIPDDPPRVRKPNPIPSTKGDLNWRQRKVTTVMPFALWRTQGLLRPPSAFPSPAPNQNEALAPPNRQPTQGDRSNSSPFRRPNQPEQPLFLASMPVRKLFRETPHSVTFGASAFQLARPPIPTPELGHKAANSPFQPIPSRMSTSISSRGGPLTIMGQIIRPEKSVLVPSQHIPNDPASGMLRARASRRVRRQSRVLVDSEPEGDSCPDRDKNQKPSRKALAKRPRAGATKEAEQKKMPNATLNESSDGEQGRETTDGESARRKVVGSRTAWKAVVVEESEDDNDDEQVKPQAKKRKKETKKMIAEPPWWSRNGRGRRKK